MGSQWEGHLCVGNVNSGMSIFFHHVANVPGCHCICFSPQCHNTIPLRQYNINLRSQVATFFPSLVLLYQYREVFHAKAEGLLPRSLFFKNIFLFSILVSMLDYFVAAEEIVSFTNSVSLLFNNFSSLAGM